MQHLILVKKLVEYCDPYACWIGLDSPITSVEIQGCIDRNEQEHTNTDFNLCKELPLNIRERHIKKIAYFIVNGFSDPISLDVGVPSLRCYVDYLVVDGNHRLASAIYKGDSHIKADISGSISYAEELGLWNPVE